MATLFDLADRLERRAEGLSESANAASIKCGLTVIGDLVHTTPVDTSKAISNWQAALDAPTYAERPAIYRGEKGSTYNASSKAAFEAARDIIQQKRPGQKLYIGNVLRYIGVLNDGSSAQAPAGFVERAVLLGRKFMTSVRVSGG